ncbi:MAG TPA: N(4)-(beta-N-acetylglucosaminyl)-L-asparaginase [Humisphaera sp.]|jgi:isoaspartyl peptidase/L-asparaginase-like protein (Ntn-hydrolase superfamily)|nr:N(4)-(beta-N-acetylglucosaminyl)-L-asparaginase [Humisphaera sp.]
MIVISTWPFGLPANAVAWNVLQDNGTALDAVEAGIMQCEDDPAVQSVGYGGLPDASGEVTLDASITDHLGRCGAVACLTRIRNPIRVARLVMEKTPHVMLVGEAATRFAIKHGIPEQNLLTDAAAQKFAEWKKSQPPIKGDETISDNTRDHDAIGDKPENHDTIGMLAIDSSGRMAGGCSTSGLAFKLPGRVGDSPIIGAGLYLEPGIGAATATGTGEEMMRVCAAHAIVENMRRGMEPQDAIREVLQRIHTRRGSEAGDVSFIALRQDGAFAGMSLWAKTNFKLRFDRQSRMKWLRRRRSRDEVVGSFRRVCFSTRGTFDAPATNRVR